MLQYKCDDAGVWSMEIDWKFSTQECSAYGARTGPKGLKGLAARSWESSVCGAQHHRDTNSALVIRARGLAWLGKESSTAAEAKADEPVVSKRGPSGLHAVGYERSEVGIPFLWGGAAVNRCGTGIRRLKDALEWHVLLLALVASVVFKTHTAQISQPKAVL